MSFPEFYSNAPRIRMYDPLAHLLGSTSDGSLEYRYEDAVRLSGHSCAAVAGTWLMLSSGLSWLYGDEIPRRGDIELHMRDAPDQGVAGVVASIGSLVTGAAQDGGFRGIAENRLHNRRGLLRFEASVDGTMGLKRRDTGAGVILDIDTGYVPHDPVVPELLPKVTASAVSLETHQKFSSAWQDRVRRLFERADDPKLIHIYDWS